MNHDIVEGNWKQLSGKIKTKWGKLTDDDLATAQGNIEHLVGKLQVHYGLTKDMAEKHLQILGASNTGEKND